MGWRYTGTGGNDTIIGQGGVVSAGVIQQNIIETPAQLDEMFGGAGNDSLSGVDGDDSLNGQQGNDTLIGGAGSDTLEGGFNDDLLEGQLGADSMNGGFGIDTVSYFDNAGVTVLLYLGQATDAGGSVDTLLEFENVNGSNVADVIVGDAGANRLAGLGGNDLLEGQAGADTIDGGLGVDTVSYFDAGAVDVRLDLGSATDSGGSADTLVSIENVNGSNAGDTIVGTTGANLVQGLGGIDFIDGNGGGDTLLGGASTDVLYGRDGADSLDGGDDPDTLYVYGVDGDTVQGGAGVDTLAIFTNVETYGVAMTVAAGATPWTVTVGGQVRATISNVEALSFAGGNARDTVNGSALQQNSVLDGGGGNDILAGGSLNDVLNGGDGNDSLFGQAGLDILQGGLGADTMNGGLGEDTFMWNLAAEGNDSIAGFASGTDRLQIDASGFGGGLAEGMDLGDAGRFVSGTAANAALGQFIYWQPLGYLGWDPDGTGTAFAAVLIARFGAGKLVTDNDLVIVA